MLLVHSKYLPLLGMLSSFLAYKNGVHWMLVLYILECKQERVIDTYGRDSGV